jgi:hypothetical protein
MEDRKAVRREVGRDDGVSKRLGESSNSKLFFRYAARVIQDECESKSVGCNLRAASHWLHVGVFVPDRNGDRVTGELSCSDELPNVFLQRTRWLEPLNEDILQAG